MFTDREGEAMAFVQTISFTTSRIDEIAAMGNEYEQEQGGQAPGYRSNRILKDRDRENSYMVVAEFDSYELAMENSARPETDAFARKMAELVDGTPTYGNYDVIDG
jgi:antibiotic biosynthesis monooxygenase (ABM) superfamily enzyme